MDPVNQTAGPDLNFTDCPNIDDFRNRVYSTSYSLVTVLGLAGNGFALVVLIKTSSRNISFHIYMMNLVVSDLLFAMMLPMRVLYYVNNGHWFLGSFLCRISSYTLYVNLYSGIYFMTAMSVTRFLAIVYPVKNLTLVTDKRARLVSVAIWVFVCLSCSPFLMSGQDIDKATNKTKCFEPPKQGSSLKKLVVLNYISLVAGFILPFLTILICYAGIIRTLASRHHAARRHRAAGVRAIRMIVIVMLAFLVSFTPYHVQRSVHLSFLARSDTSCPEKVLMQKSVVVTLCLAAANSCFDPLLYFFSREGFRTRLNSIHNSMKGSRAQQGSPRLGQPQEAAPQ
ncbi:cysteinyl leukotriene receptor 1 [Salarias fasciatus]|uniref:Cysteinyl leukotriene receptor 1-like n=1 Tax=Salarias fasciatus TaxID=181472 RepID=A0A672HR56_SALFA|nr:cysteinyl leukotriene receptor 1-like [Salarias fasciatus]XP_029964279.1 cysteinyl leukotriene receptor 1-like [Salarias fasciatus]